MECSVCISPYNKKRKLVVCPYCKYECCQDCVKRFLLNTAQVAHCMNCTKPWDYDFLFDSFPKSFVSGEYEAHQSQMALIFQKTLLPETLHRLTISDTENKLRDTSYKLERPNRQIKNYISDGSYATNYMSNKNLVQDLWGQADALIAELSDLKATRNTTTVDAKPNFSEKCPFDCTGFLSSTGKCGICNKWVCLKCHKEKESRDDKIHECIQADVDTVKLIEADCKQCPNCNIKIHRIEGCNHMWCTMCHTGFDWKSLKISNDVNDNPHLIAWRMANPTADAPCADGEVDWRKLYSLSRDDVYDPYAMRPVVFDIQTLEYLIRHIQRHEIPKLSRTDNNYEMFRIQKLKKQLTDEVWSSKIKAERRKEQKNREVLQVLELLCVAIRDVLQKLIIADKKITDETWNQIKLELLQIRSLVNTRLQKIANRMNMSCDSYIISDKWKIRAQGR